MEIEEQTDSKLAQMQVVQDLCPMNWVDRVACFRLDQHAVIDDKVSAKSERHDLAFVHNGQRRFLRDLESAFSKLMRETSSINDLEEAIAQCCVYVERRIDDRA